jgi:glycosyltransferase involved in cell wall biosynthesis
MSSGQRRRVLVLTSDAIRENMAGPAIRAWNIALTLSGDHEVRLISSRSAQLAHPNFTTEYVAAGGMGALAREESWAEVIIIQGLGLVDYPVLLRSRAVLILDAYNIMPLEHLARAEDQSPADSHIRALHATRVQNQALECADFILASSDRQRDYYLGVLGTLGRITPQTTRADESLRSLVGVAPFGITDDVPQLGQARARETVRELMPHLSTSDKLLLWGGGVYQWFDPEIVVRAVMRLATEHPSIRLLFMGLAHPGAPIGAHALTERLRRLARELDPAAQHIFFNEQWVPYSERGAFFEAADVGVTTHFDTVETRFSYRTRVLDYLWAGLPVVTTRGDVLADEVEREGIGLAVPARNEAALVEALEIALFNSAKSDEFRSRALAVREEHVWSRTLAPLREFVADPVGAIDDPRVRRRGRGRRGATPPRALDRMRVISGYEGYRGLFQRLVSRIPGSGGSASREKG